MRVTTKRRPFLLSLSFYFPWFLRARRDEDSRSQGRGRRLFALPLSPFSRSVLWSHDIKERGLWPSANEPIERKRRREGFSQVRLNKAKRGRMGETFMTWFWIISLVVFLKTSEVEFRRIGRVKEKSWKLYWTIRNVEILWIRFEELDYNKRRNRDGWK